MLDKGCCGGGSREAVEVAAAVVVVVVVVVDVLDFVDVVVDIVVLVADVVGGEMAVVVAAGMVEIVDRVYCVENLSCLGERIVFVHMQHGEHALCLMQTLQCIHVRNVYYLHEKCSLYCACCCFL